MKEPTGGRLVNPLVAQFSYPRPSARGPQIYTTTWDSTYTRALFFPFWGRLTPAQGVRFHNIT